MTSGVYLICIQPNYLRAGHYLGYSDDIERRLEEHRKGQASPLTKAAVDAGRKLVLARVWEGQDRTFERSLKNQKNGPRFCPLCNPPGQKVGPIFPNGKIGS